MSVLNHGTGVLTNLLTVSACFLHSIYYAMLTSLPFMQNHSSTSFIDECTFICMSTVLVLPHVFNYVVAYIFTFVCVMN